MLKTFCVTLLMAGVLVLNLLQSSEALTSLATPWTEGLGFQNLFIGASTPGDVQQVLGKSPDDVVKNSQIYPVVTNYYYYDESRSGAATVFVFENNFLVGLLYRSPSQQYVDISYFLPDNSDRLLNLPITAGIQQFYPSFPMYTW